MLSVKLVYATLSLLAGFIVSILLDISSTFLFFLNGLPELLLTFIIYLFIYLFIIIIFLLKHGKSIR